MSDVQIWAAIASAMAAWLALLLSSFNFWTSRRALHIAEQQEARRKPSVMAYLQDVYVAAGAKVGSRVYAILVSLSNRSDNDNAIAEVTLLLTYSKSTDVELILKVPAENVLQRPFRDEAANHLRVPIRIDAHQAVSGWCFFAVDEAILKDVTIDRTQVAFVDTHGNRETVEPMIIREYGHDVQDSKK